MSIQNRAEDGTRSPAVTSPEVTARRPVSPALAVAVIAPAVVLAIGMVAAVNLAIPALQASSLHPSVSATAWIVDSYTLVFACLLIPAGALGDRFGRKRGMLIGLGLFAAGSVMAALAPSVAVLMAGRALTGIGAAFVLPATLAVTLARVEPKDRPQAVALWSALAGVGGVIGPGPRTTVARAPIRAARRALRALVIGITTASGRTATPVSSAE
jgi:MFS family permease